MARWHLRHRLARLRAISSRARVDLLRAQVALIRALLTVRFRKRGLLVHPQEEACPALDAAVPLDVARAHELALAVRRVANHGLVRASCLPRALAVAWLLEREGLPGAIVRVGVTMQRGRFGAHAWIEYGGEHLVDSDSELTDLRRLEGLVVHPKA